LPLRGDRAALLSRIRKRVFSRDFASCFLPRVRSGQVGMYKRNPELLKLASECSRLSQEELSRVWDDVYRMLLDLYYGRARLEEAGEARVSVSTVANAVFYALYNVLGHSAVSTMYSLLEPYLIPALSGDEESARRARLLFTPVDESNVDEVLSAFRELLKASRGVMCQAARDYEILCLVSRGLPRSVDGSAGGVKDMNYCLSRLREAVAEVCGGAG